MGQILRLPRDRVVSFFGGASAHLPRAIIVPWAHETARVQRMSVRRVIVLSHLRTLDSIHGLRLRMGSRESMRGCVQGKNVQHVDSLLLQL